MKERHKMKKCCLSNVLFGGIFGFFLSLFIMAPKYIEANNHLKHDHKTCIKCVCDVKCSCQNKKEKCINKCLCD